MREVLNFHEDAVSLAAALLSSESAREELAGKVGEFLDRLIDHLGGVPTESFLPETQEEVFLVEAIGLRAHLSPKPPHTETTPSEKG
jgi:hypothetical protein